MCAGPMFQLNQEKIKHCQKGVKCEIQTKIVILENTNYLLTEIEVFMGNSKQDLAVLTEQWRD